MVIFHGYVKLPEGSPSETHGFTVADRIGFHPYRMNLESQVFIWEKMTKIQKHNLWYYPRLWKSIKIPIVIEQLNISIYSIGYCGLFFYTHSHHISILKSSNSLEYRNKENDIVPLLGKNLPRKHPSCSIIIAFFVVFVVFPSNTPLTSTRFVILMDNRFVFKMFKQQKK
jgi:hypothetical protein